MDSNLQLLIIEDVEVEAELTVRALARGGLPCNFERVETETALRRALEGKVPDLVISDFSLPQFDGIRALEIVRSLLPDVPFIFVSGTIGEVRAVEALKKGATDYVLKDKLDRLLPVVNRALQEAADHAARVRAEEELKRTEQRFEAFMQHHPGITVIKDADGRILHMNDKAEGWYGAEAGRVLGRTSDGFLASEVAQEVRERERLVRETGRPDVYVHRVEQKDGEHFWMVHRFPIPGSGSEPPLIGVASMDITEQQRMEAKLRDERNFIINASNALPGIFYVFNRQHRMLRWNVRLEEITGHGAQEIVNMRPAEFIAPEHRHRFTEQLNEAFSSGEFSLETELLDRDRNRRPYYFSGRRFEWQDDTCLVGMGVDISERLSSERRLMQYAEERKSLSARLLTAQETEQRRIAKELHDEIGQSLTVMMINLEQLQRGTAEEKQRQLIARSQTTAATLMNQVRAMSLQLRPSVLDDLGVVAAIHWYARERIAGHGLELELDLEESLPRLPAEMETTCFRIFQEAATNALRHAQAKRLTVSLHVRGARLSFAVRDDGRGFDVAAAQLRARRGGSMGLLGMQERVELLGGAYRLSSSEGKGTEISVDLPLPQYD